MIPNPRSPRSVKRNFRENCSCPEGLLAITAYRSWCVLPVTARSPASFYSLSPFFSLAIMIIIIIIIIIVILGLRNKWSRCSYNTEIIDRMTRFYLLVEAPICRRWRRFSFRWELEINTRGFFTLPAVCIGAYKYWKWSERLDNNCARNKSSRTFRFFFRWGKLFLMVFFALEHRLRARAWMDFYPFFMNGVNMFRCPCLHVFFSAWIWDTSGNDGT